MIVTIDGPAASGKSTTAKLVAKKLGISQEKTISTVKFHANTSAASIPLALSSSLEKRIIKKDDILALCAIGGGLTWGSCILKI